MTKCRVFSTRLYGLSRYSTHSQLQRKIIKERNKDVNAFINVSQEQLETSTNLLPLSGVTVAVKDNIVTNSLPTTCSSAMLKSNPQCYAVTHTKLTICADFTPQFDATVVKLLQDAGAEIIGKTNCDEFGMGLFSSLYLSHAID